MDRLPLNQALLKIQALEAELDERDAAIFGLEAQLENVENDLSIAIGQIVMLKEDRTYTMPISWGMVPE